METKHRLVLKHESGRYLSSSIDEFPLTKQIARARRFIDLEQVSAFMQTSTYAPEAPEDYEVVSIKITYEEDVSHANTESGTEESEVTARH